MVRLKGGRCHIREEMPLRRATSDEEGWFWEGNRVGRSWFGLLQRVVNCSPPHREPPLWPLPCHLLFWRTRRDGEHYKVAKLHLVSTVLQKSVRVRGVVPEAGGLRGDVYIDKGQCGSPEVGFDCQDFCCVIIGENVTVRHPIGDGVVDESDKSPTATPRSGDRA